MLVASIFFSPDNLSYINLLKAKAVCKDKSNILSYGDIVLDKSKSISIWKYKWPKHKNLLKEM